MSNAFDVTVNALRGKGLNPEEILQELSKLFQKLADFSCEPAKNKNTAAEISELLKKLCMPIQIGGYNYWVDAIMFYKESDGKLKIGEIYTKIAEKYGTTYSNAEKNMRTAVEGVFKRCAEEVLKEMFQTNISSRTGIPTNKQFLAVLAEKM